MGSECLLGDFLLLASKRRRRTALAQEEVVSARLGCQLEIPLRDRKEGGNNVVMYINTTFFILRGSACDFTVRWKQIFKE